MNITNALEILTSQEPPAFEFQREFAVFNFCGWLDSPEEPYASTNLMFLALNRALTQKQETSHLNKKYWFENILSPDSYIDQFIDGGLVSPIMEDFKLIDSEYIANIVRFLITYESNSNDKRKGASLGKAYEFIVQKKGFPTINDGSDEISFSKHEKIWALYKQRAAFHYVRWYDDSEDWWGQSDLAWVMYPDDEDILDFTISISNKRKEITNFFQKVMWIQNLLITKLDERAFELSKSIQFPSDLAAMPCHVPSLPEDASSKLAAYRRSRSGIDQTS